MGLFENFPYTNLHDLNLDWILQEVKKLKEAGGYSPENPPPYPVTSVNGKTGAVVLFNEQEGVYVRFPDSDNDQWNIYRLVNGVPAGIQFSATLPAKRMQGSNRFAIYDEGNPPPYPVTSVNGKTGAVILFSDHDGAYIQFPDSDLSQWNVYRIIDEQTNGIQFHKDGAAVRMQGTNRYQIYDEGNPPPYPVTSVNGQTGAAETPFTDHTDDVLEFVAGAVGASWGLKRTINTGSDTDEAEVEFTLQLNDSTGAPEAYIASGETVKKLLTEDDIPSSSGVVSVNGLTGVVTLNGANLPAAPDTQQTVGQAISAEAQARTLADTSLKDNITKVQNGLAYIVADTNTTGSTLAVGAFVYVKGHLSIAEGLRKVTASISANGTITTNNTEACPEGGLNSLKSKFTWTNLGTKTVIGGSETEPPSDYFTYPEGTNEIFVLCGIDNNISYAFSWMIPVNAIPDTNISFYASWYGGNSYNNAVLQVHTITRRVYVRYLSVNGTSKNTGAYTVRVR